MRDEILKIRVTKSEKQGFERVAEISGVGLSAWARKTLRSAAIRELQDVGERASFLTPLPTTTTDEADPEFLPNDYSGTVNLEHILPESTGTHWPHIEAQDIESHWKRLGNMALMSATKNNNIGNLSFEDKKKVYKDSAFTLTSQLAGYSTWGTEQIDNRQKVMAELAVKTWPL